ncbi:hypothetical protein [Bacillus pseudomycoides]|uniref:hypothetical protein n=1 Tax=Bacillus pseudomycoides TaxID=64104 RepID=UPI000BEC78BC|nr:hypothetical protein [Bacillus pseudomycoides]PEE40652.1 hypothetical protein COO02_15090 [Bacillus pseudomycoides]PGA95213.1 hypothetical protein COL91_00250 [Bacillus pseudomycoides]PHF52176.1 hypothetical protein COF72_00640 [Bacillus pseudomycoides]
MFDCCGSHHHGSHFKKAVSCPTPGTISVPFPNPCPTPPLAPGTFLARTAALATSFDILVTNGFSFDVPLTVASKGNGIGFDPVTGKLVILISGFYNLYYEFKAISRGGNLDSASTQLTANGTAIPGSQAVATLTLMGTPKLVEVPFAQRPATPVFLTAGTQIGIQAFMFLLPGMSSDLLTVTSAVLTIESAF